MTSTFEVKSYVLKFKVDDELTPFVKNKASIVKLFTNKVLALLDEGWRCPADKPVKELISEITSSWGEEGFSLKKGGLEVIFTWLYPAWVVSVKSKKVSDDFINELGIAFDELVIIKKASRFKKSKAYSKIKGVRVSRQGDTYMLSSKKKLPPKLLYFLNLLEFSLYASEFNAQSAVKTWNNGLSTVEEVLKLEHLLGIHEPGSKGLAELRERLTNARSSFNQVREDLIAIQSYQRIIRDDLTAASEELDEEELGEIGVVKLILDKQRDNMSINDYILIHVREISKLIEDLDSRLDSFDKQNQELERLFTKRVSLLRAGLLLVIMIAVLFMAIT